MRLQHRVTLSLAVLAAITLAGCGKKPIDPEKRATAQAGKGDDAEINAARLKLKSLVQAQPKSSEARYQLGLQLLADGDAAAAVIELQRAQDFKHPENLVLPRLAEAMNLAGQNKQVIDQFADKRLSDPEAGAALMASVAESQAQQGDMAAANKTVERALATAPKSERALLARIRLLTAGNDLSTALATVETLLAAHPNSHEGWAVKGDLLLRTPDGRPQALAAYEKSTQIKPDYLYAMSGLLSLRMAMHDVDGAKKDLAKLKTVAPKHVITGMFEANLAYATGEHAKARDIYQALLRSLPEDVSVLLSAGENELKLHAPQQAEAYFAKASSIAPRNVLARRLLAEAQIALGQAARALVTLAPLVEATDASADVVALAAQASLLNGDAKAADTLFKRLAKLKPTDPKLRTVLASASLGKGNETVVYNELREIAAVDSGVTADLALISGLIKGGQPDAALSAVDDLQKKRPSDPVPQQLRGQILIGKADRPGARKAFEAALALDKTYYPAAAALALLDLQDTKYDDARKRFADIIKLQPKDVRAILGLAELQARLDAPRAEVQRLLDSAVKEVPNDVNARLALITHHMGGTNNVAALSAAQAAVAAVPDNLELLDLLGKCQLRANQASQAIASFGKMVSLQPKSPRGHIGMVDAYMATNELGLAQKSMDRALELAPRQVDVIGHAVALASRKNQYPAAIEYCRRLQADRPTESLGFLLEGELEMARSNWDAAAIALRKGIDRPAPGAGATKLYHSLLRSGKAAEATAFAGQWLKTHPKDTSLLFYLGNAAQAKGDAATAETRYEQVLAANAGHVLALNNLAMLRIQQKKPGAVGLAERAVEGAPEQALLLDTLAQAYASENKISKAIEAQQHAVAVAPTDGTLRLGLARYQLEAGNKALAKAELDKLTALGTAFPAQAEVQRLLASLGSGLPGR